MDRIGTIERAVPSGPKGYRLNTCQINGTDLRNYASAQVLSPTSGMKLVFWG